MSLISWLKGWSGKRRTCSYNTVIKFVYRMETRKWHCAVPSSLHENLTPDGLIRIALKELGSCSPRRKGSSSYGHVWPGGSNLRYVVEFVFVGRIHDDGFMGWEVSYSHPNEDGHIEKGIRFPYSPLDNGSIEAFLRLQIREAEMEILTKILTLE